jgi:hypothetical protein
MDKKIYFLEHARLKYSNTGTLLLQAMHQTGMHGTAFCCHHLSLGSPASRHHSRKPKKELKIVSTLKEKRIK